MQNSKAQEMEQHAKTMAEEAENKAQEAARLHIGKD